MPVPPPQALPAPVLDAPRPFGQAAVPVLRFGWPVRPFHRQHLVRGTLGEPRGVLGLPREPDGPSWWPALRRLNPLLPLGRRVLHTGVDILAPDGTPVYAVESGVARMGGLGYEQSVQVGHFAFWLLAGGVPDGARVVAFRTVIGRVYPGQHHVHLTRFARGRVPVNPLVAGGLTPFRDVWPPRIGALCAYTPGGGRVPLAGLRGRVALVAQAYDVKAGGTHTGVYRLRWALWPLRGRRPAVGPDTVLQLDVLPGFPVSDYLYTLDSVRHRAQTRFRYRLTARTPEGDGMIDLARVRAGRYRLVVTAWDERGNARRRAFGVRVVAPARPPA